DGSTDQEVCMSAGPAGLAAATQGVPRAALHQVGGVLPTRQRRPALVAVAVLLIVSGALGGLQLLTASSHKVSALVLVNEVPAGHVIESADLGTAALSGKVAYTPASAEASVVGKTAARDLFAGQLLTHSMMSTPQVPDNKHALVGLRLKAGQVPSAGLADGDTVELVQVPDNGAAGITAPLGTTIQAAPTASLAAGGASSL